MAKFSNRPAAKPRGPVSTSGTRTLTHEGGAGWLRTPESELFLLAATNFVGEDTFYERAADRDSRFVRLVHEVTKSNPEFLAGIYIGETSGLMAKEREETGKVGFIEYLRNQLNMRSATIVAAAEYVKAGGPKSRRVIDRAIVRGDEPAEMLGYWLSTHGRKVPMPVKRGIADAATRLYTQRNALRYDGLSRGIRMADVLELTHAKPKEAWQSALFKYLLDKRHHPDSLTIDPVLETILLDERLRAIPEPGRRVALKEGLTAQAGWPWERLAGWLPGGMDKEAWEAVIPTMGYMALIRNLRNFEQAKVSDAVCDSIIAKIKDPEEVAKSRQFPYRFWSAYKNNESIGWAPALETALELSCQNIPELPGRTLVLIDISGSMQAPISDRSKVQRYEIGALFGAALAKKCEKVDVVLFADGPLAHPVSPSTSVLRYVESVGKQIGVVGYGTNVHGSLRQAHNGHERTVIFSDEASHDAMNQAQKAKIPLLHVFNLGGYRAATFESGPGCWAYGGFSDAFFAVMATLEAGDDADWPF